MAKKYILLIWINFFQICIGLPSGFTWEWLYGGSGINIPYQMIEILNEGYVIVGASNSFSGGYYDIWILKINYNGEIEWQKYLGTDYNDAVHSITKTVDGGYAFAGFITEYSEGEEQLIIKLNSQWQIQWQFKIGSEFGDNHNERAYSIISTNDGKLLTIGFTDSFGQGFEDVWITKINLNGVFSFYKTYGGNKNEIGYSIIQNKDGSYLAAGATESFGAGAYDAFLLKLDIDGNIQRQKVYGTAGEEWIYSMIETFDGGYILCGYTAENSLSQRDILVIKVNSDGIIQWAKKYYTPYDEAAYKIIQLSNGDYLIAGYISSPENYDDFLIMKIDSSGNIIWQKKYGGTGYDRALSLLVNNSGENYLLLGYNGSYSFGNYDIWVLGLDENGEIGGNCISSISTNLIADNINMLSLNSQFVADVPIYWGGMTSMTFVQSNAPYSICKNQFGAGTVPDNDNYQGFPLMISKENINLRLSWGIPGGNCVTEDYAIYRGSLPFTGYNHLPLICSTGNQNTAIINIDEGSYFYLVVAENKGNEGSYGLDSNNLQRPPSINPCFPQKINGCN